MSTLAPARNATLADLLERSASTITVDIIRRTRTGTHLRTEFKQVYDTIVAGLEEAGFDRDSMPGYAAYAIDQLLQAAKGTSFRTERLTSSQTLFRAAQRLEEAITSLRTDPKDTRAV